MFGGGLYQSGGGIGRIQTSIVKEIELVMMLYKILLHLIFSIVSTAKDENTKRPKGEYKSMMMINNLINRE